jgi:hypothetical protein
MLDKPRVLVLTGMTDNTDVVLNEPVKMTPVYNATLASKEMYARSHGYDFMSLRSFGTDEHNLLGHVENKVVDETTIRGTGLLRVLRTFQMVNFYDYVMWIDGDSLITNKNYSIEDFGMTDDEVFCASYDWEWDKSFSTGNFIIKNNKRFNEFANIFCALAKNYNFPHEQAILNYMSKINSIGCLFRILEHKYLGAAPSTEMYFELCNVNRKVPHPWNSDSFLIHLTGVCNQSRLNILETHFKSFI